MMKKGLIMLCAVLLAVAVTGCSTQTSKTEQPTKDYSIKLGGSSTLSPVMAKCADDFTEKYKNWKKVRDTFPDEAITIFVATGGSGFGVKSAINSSVDMGLVAREVTSAEKEKLSDHKLYTLGYDALTIAVHPQNPIVKVKPNMTTAEIKKVFAGEIKTWDQLDPALPKRPIVIAIRDLGGGANQAFDEAIMKSTPISQEALQLPSMGALAGKVQENIDAIGYVSFGFVNQNKGKIATLSVDGVEPTVDSIATGAYKIARPLIVIAKNQPDEREQEFMKYLLSEHGMKTLADMGFIPAKK